MKLQLPLIAFWLLSASAAYAQTETLPPIEKPAAPASEELPLSGRPFNDVIPAADGPMAAAEDTVHALTTLYSRRRVGGISWITGSTLGGIRVLTAASQKKTVSGSYGTAVVNDGASTGGIAAGIGIMLLFDAYGASKLARFSAAKQAALIADVRAGKPLPANVRHRLKPRFFKQVLVPYKAVKYKAA
ncbi:hypothetical protein MUN82_14575 [Hymenobacter aerilatus]|uniref:Uncharacterized protein n=1 Tax=Hymenobacter aerilatus TaxID=2932251 RepID=A0A8T9SWJ7_9BACT|nr:hypothetical protein [Hymenobacter aerilatus]UOR04166.1 hypothetical protein MUN82_14575 [Hymenobacter aerilatus]